MKKNFVSNSTESTRMFKSDFLDSLSKVPFYVPLIVYIPVIFYCFWTALVPQRLPILDFLISFCIALIFWSLTEYVLHRFVFHFHPKATWGKRIHFIFHGVHHDYPNDAKRLVMPPSVSIPLSLAFFFLFKWLLPASYLYSFFAGFITGYLIYDMMHYALHHLNIKNPLFAKIKKHHMLHHYSDETKGYGVSSDMWDGIFRTNFQKK